MQTKSVTTLLTTTILFISFFYAITSCSKQQTETKALKANTLAVTPTANITDTLYDFSLFGQAHNGYLDYLTTNPDFHPGDTTGDYNYGKNYIDPNLGKWAGSSFDTITAIAGYLSDRVDDMAQGILPGRRFLQDGICDSSLADFYDSLSVIYQAALDTTGGSYYSIATFSDAVNSLEEKIKAQGNILYDPKMHLANVNAVKLIACEVAKSSYTYWISIAEGSGNQAWVPVGLHIPGFIKNAWHAIKVAAVDAYTFADNLNIDTSAPLLTNLYYIINAWSTASSASANVDKKNV